MNEKVVTKFLEILSSRSQSYGIVVPWTKSVKKGQKSVKKVQPVCKKWAALTIYIM